MNRKRCAGMLLAMLLTSAGCSKSRYGVHHDERLAGIQRVGVLVPSVKVYSLHTGGIPEERPDMELAVLEQTVAAIKQEVSRCHREPVALSVPGLSPESKGNVAADRAALLGAISEGIMTHHYLFGKKRVIDYTSGDAPKVLGRDDIDALLCAYVYGVVPTVGREGLEAAVLVVGLATGVPVLAFTKQATLVLLLVDCRTGEVLWFNCTGTGAKVDDKNEFRRLCKDACADLLRPSK